MPSSNFELASAPRVHVERGIVPQDVHDTVLARVAQWHDAKDVSEHKTREGWINFGVVLNQNAGNVTALSKNLLQHKSAVTEVSEALAPFVKKAHERSQNDSWEVMAARCRRTLIPQLSDSMPNSNGLQLNIGVFAEAHADHRDVFGVPSYIAFLNENGYGRPVGNFTVFPGCTTKEECKARVEERRDFYTMKNLHAGDVILVDSRSFHVGHYGDVAECTWEDMEHRMPSHDGRVSVVFMQNDDHVEKWGWWENPHDLPLEVQRHVVAAFHKEKVTKGADSAMELLSARTDAAAVALSHERHAGEKCRQRASASR